MNRLENVWHVSFHGGETGFVEFDTARAGFLDTKNLFPDSRDEEFGLPGWFSHKLVGLRCEI